MQRIRPSATLKIANKVRELKSQGKDIISFTYGEPDFDTPDYIKHAGVEAIQTGKTRYTSTYGILELRKAISHKLKLDNNLDYNVDQIIVGCGAKQILYSVFMATINSEDEVIVPTPCWASYPDMISLFGGNFINLETKHSDNFRININKLESLISNKTKWLLLNLPNNPSGVVYNSNELEEIADMLLRYPHVNILVDDIYEHIVFDNNKYISFATVATKLRDRLFVVNGVSKAYAMTGWRLGYGAGPKALIDAIATLQSQSTTHASSISQYAAVTALTSGKDVLEENVKKLENKRDIAYELLQQIKEIECPKPQGAFYLLPSIHRIIGKKTPDQRVIENDIDFVEYLLEYGVAVVPGEPFFAKNHVRISFGTSIEDIKSGINKIAKAVSDLK